MQQKHHTNFSKVLLIILGGTLLVISIFNLIVAAMDMYRQYYNFHEKDFIFMPVLMVFGIAYLTLGTTIRQINKSRFYIHLILSTLTVFWVVIWAMYTYNDIVISDSPADPLGGNEKVLFLTQLILRIPFVIIPQVLIGIKLKKPKMNNEPA